MLTLSFLTVTVMAVLGAGVASSAPLSQPTWPNYQLSASERSALLDWIKVPNADLVNLYRNGTSFNGHKFISVSVTEDEKLSVSILRSLQTPTQYICRGNFGGQSETKSVNTTAVDIRHGVLSINAQGNPVCFTGRIGNVVTSLSVGTSGISATYNRELVTASDFEMLAESDRATFSWVPLTADASINENIQKHAFVSSVDASCLASGKAYPPNYSACQVYIPRCFFTSFPWGRFIGTQHQTNDFTLYGLFDGAGYPATPRLLGEDNLRSYAISGKCEVLVAAPLVLPSPIPVPI